MSLCLVRNSALKQKITQEFFYIAKNILQLKKNPLRAIFRLKSYSGEYFTNER